MHNLQENLKISSKIARYSLLHHIYFSNHSKQFIHVKSNRIFAMTVTILDVEEYIFYHLT